MGKNRQFRFLLFAFIYEILMSFTSDFFTSLSQHQTKLLQFLLQGTGGQRHNNENKIYCSQPGSCCRNWRLLTAEMCLFLHMDGTITVSWTTNSAPTGSYYLLGFHTLHGSQLFSPLYKFKGSLHSKFHSVSIHFNSLAQSEVSVSEFIK